MRLKRGLLNLFLILIVFMLSVSQVSSVVFDTDKDGMPDEWERKNGFAPDKNDASEDRDNDGLTNSEEYQSGTNPNSADSDGDGTNDSSDPEPFNPKVPFTLSWVNVGIILTVVCIAFIVIFYLFTLDYSKLFAKKIQPTQKPAMAPVQSSNMQKPAQSSIPRMQQSNIPNMQNQKPSQPFYSLDQRMRMRQELFNKFDNKEQTALPASQPSELRPLPIRKDTQMTPNRDEAALAKLSVIAKKPIKKGKK
jgi:hypothetical protein